MSFFRGVDAHALQRAVPSCCFARACSAARPRLLRILPIIRVCCCVSISTRMLCSAIFAKALCLASFFVDIVFRLQRDFAKALRLASCFKTIFFVNANALQRVSAMLFLMLYTRMLCSAIFRSVFSHVVHAHALQRALPKQTCANPAWRKTRQCARARCRKSHRDTCPNPVPHARSQSFFFNV